MNFNFNPLPDPTYLDNRPDFKAMLFALMALAAVSLPLLAQLPTGVVAVFALFMLVRIILLAIGVRGLKWWQLMPLAAVVVALVLNQLGTVVGLQGGISFLLLLAALKSFEGNTRRDWQVLVLAMLFLLTGALLFEDGLFTGLWVLLCLMMMAAALSMLNGLTFKHSLKQSGTAFLLTLLPMALLFVTMPRRASPMWGVPQQAQSSTTGMSETMQPGSIGNLVQSNEPVFSATFENGFVPKNSQLYWRMMIMGNHDGTAWQLLRDYTDDALPPESGNIAAYQMIVEDEKGRIPALDYPLKTERFGLYRAVGDILLVRSREGVRRIRLQSNLTDELPHRLHRGEFEYFTKLPENGNLRTRALAKELYRQSGGNTEAFVAAAYQYFTREKFVYTLKPPVYGTQNSTDGFMFEGKQGFCEHYADAFVVMMRAAGVPARVVTGYQGGEWNEQGGFWQIRSKHAHAWTEVWIAERNVWKRIDPTAAAASTRVESGVEQALPASELGELVAKQSWLTNMGDRSRFYWQQWIVNYDNSRQQSLFAALGFNKVSLFSIIAVLLMGAVPALIPVWLWWRRSRSQDVEPMAHGFMLLKRRLLGADYPAIAALGAQELRQILDEEDRLSEELDTLLNDYLRLNYANAAAPDAKQAKNWYRRARRLARKYRIQAA